MFNRDALWGIPVDFGASGGKTTVSLPLDKWIDDDLSAWKWLAQVKDPQLAEMAQRLRARIERVRGEASEAVAAYAKADRKLAGADFAKQLAQVYAKNKLPPQSARTAKTIQAIAKNRPNVAATALAVVVGEESVPSNALALALEAYLQLEKEKEELRKVVAEARALSQEARKVLDAPASTEAVINDHFEQVKAQLAAELAQQSKTYDQLAETANSARQSERDEWAAAQEQVKAQLASELARQSKTYDQIAETANSARQSERDDWAAVQEQLKAECSQLLKSAKDNFDALATTMDAHIKLEAPVKYWTDKRDAHGKNAWRAAGGLALWLLACLASVAIAARYLLDVEAGDASTLRMWHFATFGTFVALCVWVARLIARTMLSHQHLESDAHERIVIAMTFLALLRREHVPEEPLLREVLSALLRHSPDGIVKEDALPLWTDLLSKKKE